ncbi:MAG: thiamine pyrophosphate-dependent enzyme, partial [Planctomycetota bacterium]
VPEDFARGKEVHQDFVDEDFHREPPAGKGSQPAGFTAVPRLDSSDSRGAFFVQSALNAALRSSRRGPVHVNWMFREPFTVNDVSSPAYDALSADAADPPSANSIPFTMGDSIDGDDVPDVDPIEIQGNVIIALGGCNADAAQQSTQLARRLGCPLLADVTSGVRAGSFDITSQPGLPIPDTIVHLGGRIVSKAWWKWTGELDTAQTSLLHVTPTGQTINPHGRDIRKLHCPLRDLDSLVVHAGGNSDFADVWTTAIARRDRAIHAFMIHEDRISEPAIAFHISQTCPHDMGLFLGNSTPIRDMDWFGRGGGSLDSATPIIRNVAANRGASGIDGLLATAMGYAEGLQRRVTAIVGDLSALHDLNSLSLVAKSRWPMVIVIINNHAGHIFDLLPIRKSKHFEQFFATPHQIQFQHAAEMFGIDYTRVSQLQAFRDAYSAAIGSDRTTVLEVLTDRQINVEVRREIHDEIEQCRD